MCLLNEWASHVVQWWSLPANAGDVDLLSGLRRSPGGGSGNPLQYSCLENSRWATVHRVTKSQTMTNPLSMHVHIE